MTAARNAIIAPLACIAAILAACKGNGSPDPPAQLTHADYDLVAREYNRRISPITSFSALAVVDVEFLDEDGDRDWEQGNGRLQFRSPDDLALNIGKLGDTMFWVGCNRDLYWIFDLRDGQDLVYFGRNAHRGRHAAARLGWPIVPRDLAVVTANAPLPDTNALTRQGLTAHAWAQGHETTLEWRAAERPTTRFVLDSETLLPLRIVLFDEAGTPAVRALLQQHEGLPVSGMGGSFPKIATRYVITDLVTGNEVRIRLEQQREKTLNETLFDLQGLAETLKVEHAVDLDQPLEAAQ